MLLLDPKKEATLKAWAPTAKQKSGGLVAIQLKSRHGVTTDHLTPAQARELAAELLLLADKAETR